MMFNPDPDLALALIEKDGVITAYQGQAHRLKGLDDIESLARQQGREVVFVLPYCAIRERGFEAQGDEPVLALPVEQYFTVDPKDLPDEEIILNGTIVPSIDDESYAALIARFQAEAIEKGHCAQATISRKFSGQICDFSLSKALSLYRRLLNRPGHYMTILFYYEGQCLIAGTPERHLEIVQDQTIMTPIAGTFRKDDHVSLPDFLNDPKEINELFQVVDEEMKMMSVICPEGGRISGPYLREVGSVIHTEYNLVGRRSLRAIEALRRSLHAPTVAGSPLESAARQIRKFEPESRRYYAGEIGIYKPDHDELDCAILLRGAEIFANGHFHVQAGGGIVRDSVPEQEARESRAKANGILKALTGQDETPPQLTPKTRAALEPILSRRNSQLAPFWFAAQDDAPEAAQEKLPGSITIINNEDDFAFMIAHMLRSLGVDKVSICDTFSYEPGRDHSALVLLGPGPGDPADMSQPRMKRLQEIITSLQDARRRFMGICLGHQAIAVHYGLAVPRQSESTQGLPRTVTLAGQEQRLAFYNSFSPLYNGPQTGPLENIDMDIDEQGRIIAMNGPHFTSFQFHPESVMAIDGRAVLRAALQNLARP